MQVQDVKIRLKVREIAEAKGWNASRLARRVDMSNTPMYNIFSGVTQDPGILTLIKIARVLGCELGDLYEVVEFQRGDIDIPGYALAA